MYIIPTCSCQNNKKTSKMNDLTIKGKCAKRYPSPFSPQKNHLPTTGSSFHHAILPSLTCHAIYLSCSTSQLTLQYRFLLPGLTSPLQKKHSSYMAHVVQNNVYKQRQRSISGLLNKFSESQSAFLFNKIAYYSPTQLQGLNYVHHKSLKM